MELQNRTIICAVLFLDIVEYSRKPVAEQMTLRDRFNVLLREALDGVAANDRVILDTGDGAAVTFLGEPEDATLTAARLRDAIAAELLPREHQLSLRCGINLGPVKLVKDLNARPNIIGDGINVAQRIMGFAQPGQVLVSRSYFEVVSRLSQEYANLFQYEGARTDKHVREHEVYALGSEDGTPVTAGVRESRWGAAARRLMPTFARIAERVPTSPLASTLTAMLAILAVGAVMRVTRDLPDARFTGRAPLEARRASLDLSAYPPPAAGSPVTVAAAAPVRPPDVARPKAIAFPAIEPPVEPVLELPSESASPEPAPKKLIPVKKAPARRVMLAALPAPEEVVIRAEMAPAPAPAPAQNEEFAHVTIAAFPWGEIYVDGAQQGVTPPVHNIQVRPGRHQIEIRNTTFPSHHSTIEVRPSEQITIRHRFQSGEPR